MHCTQQTTNQNLSIQQKKSQIPASRYVPYACLPVNNICSTLCDLSPCLPHIQHRTKVILFILCLRQENKDIQLHKKFIIKVSNFMWRILINKNMICKHIYKCNITKKLKCELNHEPENLKVHIFYKQNISPLHFLNSSSSF